MVGCQLTRAQPNATWRA